MSRFKPQASFITDESKNEYYNGRRKSMSIVNEYPTYAKLKRSMRALLNASFDEFVFVVRSKRGEWGEWFEHWTMENGEPTIIKEGWS